MVDVRWLWLTPWLTGCPFVFGGPDLSNVPGTIGPGDTADPDPDPTSDTSDTSDTTDTSDSGSVDGEAPELVVVSLEPTPEGAVLTLVVSDADGDMDGGSIEVVDGAQVDTYRVPEDLVQWTLDGPSVIGFTTESPCDGFVFDLAVTAIDAAGNRSAPDAAVVSVEGFGVLSSPSNPSNVGPLSPPTLLCGELEASFAPDQVAFTWGGGTVQADLTWAGSGADLDLFLLDEDNATVAQSLTYYDVPEHIETIIGAGDYVWAINHFAGPLPTPWSLLVIAP